MSNVKKGWGYYAAAVWIAFFLWPLLLVKSLAPQETDFDYPPLPTLLVVAGIVLTLVWWVSFAWVVLL